MIFSSKGPRDDLSESIYHFLLDAVARNNGSTDKLEIEAKFGLIIDKGTNERIQLPVMSECILNHEGWTNFVSDMPLNLHKTFNEALNKRFADRSLGWKYTHTKTVDHILPDKTRITLDSNSGTLLHAQKKHNLSHLAVYQPNFIMDIRLSANVEIPIPLDTVEKEFNHPMVIKRKKDRVAYEVAQGLLSVDLTQVIQNDGGANKLKHELELEVKDLESLLNSPESFQSFVDSIRELCQLIKF